MSELEVRIEELPPMRVAFTSALGESPELEAWDKLIAWAKPKGLLEDFGKNQFYGFNNPDPSPGKPEYGYEVWVTIDESIEPEGEMKVKDFTGGLYAVTSCRGVSNIYNTWMQFAEWCKKSEYNFGKHQWLEKHISKPGETGLEEIELDLYLPIAE